MSADNFYVIRRHPAGGFAAVMGFASDVDENGDEVVPEVNPAAPAFSSVEEALDATVGSYAEYGMWVHDECYDTSPAEAAVSDVWDPESFEAGAAAAFALAAECVRENGDLPAEDLAGLIDLLAIRGLRPPSDVLDV